MPHVIFVADTHQYFSEDRSIEYASISRVVKPLQYDFDSTHWTTVEAVKRLLDPPHKHKNYNNFKNQWLNANAKLTVEHPLYLTHCLHVYGKQIESIIPIVEKEWKENGLLSSKKGTLYHSERERIVYERGYEINPFTGKKYRAVKYHKEYDNQSLVDNLYNLPDGCYPEMLIWSDKYRTAGQEDRVFIETIGRFRYVDLDDYKTDKKIPSYSYGRKMLPPLQHIDDHKLNGYGVKVSMYACMLEEFGFIPRHMALHNFNTKYDLTYFKEVRDVLELRGALLSKIAS